MCRKCLWPLEREEKSIKQPNDWPAKRSGIYALITSKHHFYFSTAKSKLLLHLSLNLLVTSGNEIKLHCIHFSLLSVALSDTSNRLDYKCIGVRSEKTGTWKIQPLKMSENIFSYTCTFTVVTSVSFFILKILHSDGWYIQRGQMCKYKHWGVDLHSFVNTRRRKCYNFRLKDFTCTSTFTELVVWCSCNCCTLM